MNLKKYIVYIYSIIMTIYFDISIRHIKCIIGTNNL